MQKQQTTVSEYILSQREWEIVKKCLMYSRHRIKTHKKYIAVDISEIDKLLAVDEKNIEIPKNFSAKFPFKIKIKNIGEEFTKIDAFLDKVSEHQMKHY